MLIILNAEFWSAASTVLALFALIYSIRASNQSVMLAHYGAFNQMYADLLKIGIDKPHLRSSKHDRTPDEQQQYKIYAHLAWCFVESIYDHCVLNKKLMATWRSAVIIEDALHREWLERPENRSNFKKEFYTFIAATFPKTNAA